MSDRSIANELETTLSAAYEAMEGSKISMEYSARHGIKSAAVLTIFTDEMASLTASYLEPQIAGKTVVEIGGGIGLLALHLGTIAKRVFCIEANPVWAESFVHVLLEKKPKNVSYLFGAAEEFEGIVRGDVALFCSHSGIPTMKKVAARFAPVVIDVYGKLIDGNPNGFDPIARCFRHFEEEDFTSMERITDHAIQQELRKQK